ncbi:helix-turn-helix domain-containing protein [Amycolatopsis sp. NPDC057786]|uniref:helix-turn-helix domain-containing protein n=1 Tax=Amycolatopsis sp. NPDC057786 TaxID=3346250 RepID=UPI0036702BA8
MDDHTVTGRVLAVLDAVAARERTSLAGLARDTGIPKPTARRIAADLVIRGLLRRVQGGYQLGDRLISLGVRAADQRNIRLATVPHVHDLHTRTGQISWTFMLTPTAFTLLDLAFAPQCAAEIRQNPWPTDFRSRAFVNSALGRILLTDRPELAEPHRGTCPRLATAVQVVRDTGIAVEHEQTRPGYSCLAVHLRSPDGTLVGALGVTGRTGISASTRFTRPLLAAAEQVTRALG